MGSQAEPCCFCFARKHVSCRCYLVHIVTWCVSPTIIRSHTKNWYQHIQTYCRCHLSVNHYHLRCILWTKRHRRYSCHCSALICILCFFFASNKSPVITIVPHLLVLNEGSNTSSLLPIWSGNAALLFGAGVQLLCSVLRRSPFAVLVIPDCCLLSLWGYDGHNELLVPIFVCMKHPKDVLQW
jgi:hypothetical protein